MRHKYIYKNKKTGRKIFTNQKMDSSSFELVSEVRNGLMKSAGFLTK